MEGEIVNNKDEKALSKDDKNNSILKEYLFHPTTVALLVLLDWGGTFLEIPTTLAPMLLILTALSIFGISFFLTYNIQMKLAGDDRSKALKKGLIAGLLCAIPYPVMSSAFGLVILSLSGVNAIQNFGPEGLVEMFKKRDSNKIAD